MAMLALSKCGRRLIPSSVHGRLFFSGSSKKSVDRLRSAEASPHRWNQSSQHRLGFHAKTMCRYRIHTLPTTQHQPQQQQQQQRQQEEQQQQEHQQVRKQQLKQQRSVTPTLKLPSLRQFLFNDSTKGDDCDGRNEGESVPPYLAKSDYAGGNRRGKYFVLLSIVKWKNIVIEYCHLIFKFSAECKFC